MKKFTSKMLMAFVAIGACATISAQTVIKVGASQGAKQTTIQMAYDSVMPAIIEGAYVIEIQSDYDPTAETYPIRLKSKAGATAQNNITIKPATGVKKVIGPANKTVIVTGLDLAPNAAAVEMDLAGKITNGIVSDLPDSTFIFGKGIYAAGRYKKVEARNGEKVTFPTGTIVGTIATGVNKVFLGPAQTCAIKLDSAKFVTIDGVSRTGDTGLTIQNPNSIFAQTIFFTGTAQNNTIKNCIIRGANVSPAWNNGYNGTIFFQAVGANVCMNNVIDNNDICDMNDPNIPFPLAAFQMTAAGGSHKATTVSNNNIYNITDQYTEGSPNFTFMQFGSEGGSTDNQVLNNRFFWTATVNFGRAFTPLNIGTLGVGNRFEGNVIGFGGVDGSGVSTIISTQSWGTSNGFRFFTCKNNTLGGIHFTGTGFRGFWAHTSSASYAADDIMNGNTVKDIVFTSVGNDKTLEGIYISAALATGVNVKNNKVSNIQIISEAGNKCTVSGIRANSTGANEFNYTGNKVIGVVAGDLNSTAANLAYGLYVTANAKKVEGNLIADVTVNSSNTGAVVRGIQTSGSNLGGQLVANNIVRIGTTVGNDVSITALFQEAATSTGDPIKIYNNTLYVGGTSPAAATKSTYGYFRNTGNAHLIDFQNNIVANKRTVSGTTAFNYAMQINAKSEFSACNYNLFQYGGNLGKVTSLVDLTQGVTGDAPDLLIWQAGVELDANSVAADPQFENATAEVPDMRIKENSAAKAAGNNLTSTVASDFNGFTRTSNDIGALAYGTVSAVQTVKPATLGVYGATNTIVVKDMMGQTARIYTMNGQLVKAAQLLSDKENVQVANGLYIVRIGSFSTKVLVK